MRPIRIAWRRRQARRALERYALLSIVHNAELAAWAAVKARSL